MDRAHDKIAKRDALGFREFLRRSADCFEARDSMCLLVALLAGIQPQTPQEVTMQRAITIAAAIVLFSVCPLYALYSVKNQGT
jgi:hypothetical protein